MPAAWRLATATPARSGEGLEGVGVLQGAMRRSTMGGSKACGGGVGTGCQPSQRDRPPVSGSAVVAKKWAENAPRPNRTYGRSTRLAAPVTERASHRTQGCDSRRQPQFLGEWAAQRRKTTEPGAAPDRHSSAGCAARFVTSAAGELSRSAAVAPRAIEALGWSGGAAPALAVTRLPARGTDGRRNSEARLAATADEARTWGWPGSGGCVAGCHRERPGRTRRCTRPPLLGWFHGPVRHAGGG